MSKRLLVVVRRGGVVRVNPNTVDLRKGIVQVLDQGLGANGNEDTDRTLEGSSWPRRDLDGPTRKFHV